MKKLLKWMLSALYGLVMIEVIVMISPFAFYFYAFYAPTLQGLHRTGATAWMENFFLPHSVITTNSALEFLRWWVGTYAFSLGVIAFFVCAAHVYGSKLLRRGPVRSWIYSYIRHPQYLSLAVAGFGLLTMWPRIIILILYLGMLFAYYFLARFEEKQMEAKYPEYAEYRRRTGMFLPGNPGGNLFRWLFGWISNPTLARGVASMVIVGVVLGGALLLRRFTIRDTARALVLEERTLAIAVWPISGDKIQRVVGVALRDERVRSELDKESGAAFTAHLLPSDYGMVNMFADVGTDHRMFSRISSGRFRYLVSFLFPFLVPDLKNRIMGSPQDRYKVVFSRVDAPGGDPLPVFHVTDLGAKMTPVVIAEVEGAANTLQEVTVPPRRSFWGDITMPMF